MKKELATPAPERKRTRVLFAFGDHGCPKPGVNSSPDREFFKKAVCPWLEKETSEGRGVLVVQEQDAGLVIRGLSVLMPEVGAFIEDPEGNMRAIMVVLTAANAGYSFALNTGQGLESYVMWGHEEVAARINREVPNSVVFICEPQTKESVLASMRFQRALMALDSLQSEGKEVNFFDTWALFLQASIENIYARDVALRTIIPDILRRYDISSVLIPRGRVHMKMVELFEPELFDVSVEPQDLETLENEVCGGSPAVALHFDRYYGPVPMERIKYAVLEPFRKEGL